MIIIHVLKWNPITTGWTVALRESPTVDAQPEFILAGAMPHPIPVESDRHLPVGRSESERFRVGLARQPADEGYLAWEFEPERGPLLDPIALPCAWLGEPSPRVRCNLTGQACG